MDVTTLQPNLIKLADQVIGADIAATAFVCQVVDRDLGSAAGGPIGPCRDFKNATHQHGQK